MEDFVTFKIAKKLKEKGFDWLNISTYNPKTRVRNNYNKPTISQVLKWLREEKKIFIAINIGYCYESYEKPFPTNPKMEPILKGYYYGVWDLGNLNDKNGRSEYFESHELAALAGIEYALNLI